MVALSVFKMYNSRQNPVKEAKTAESQLSQGEQKGEFRELNSYPHVLIIIAFRPSSLIRC